MEPHRRLHLRANSRNVHDLAALSREKSLGVVRTGPIIRLSSFLVAYRRILLSHVDVHAAYDLPALVAKPEIGERSRACVARLRAHRGFFGSPTSPARDAGRYRAHRRGAHLRATHVRRQTSL